MSRKRFLIASDTHWCHLEWYGVSTEERMERFVRHVREEYEKEPFEALLLLGDYSLDHWKWNIKGCWLTEGRSNTKVFADRVITRLKELNIPMAAIAGNHEQYGNVLWHELTGFARTDALAVGDVLFILPDTFGANLDPTVHSDGTYCGTDVDFVRREMAKHPDKKVILCAHHFEPSRESDAFRQLVAQEDRILCLFGGHVHRSNVVELGEEWGNKALLYTGQYSYNNGKNGPPMNSMWGFRDLILEDGMLTSRYITPANTIVFEEKTVEHPYGYQDMYQTGFSK
ncbi:MAG: metallophosphoesterase [Clostridia bacterium]|nr:metallophosphoesterase [Clostridia bacterium]